MTSDKDDCNNCGREAKDVCPACNRCGDCGHGPECRIRKRARLQRAAAALPANTIVYMRVSSSSQSTASQEADLKSWAKSQPGEIQWVNETGSGTTMGRPELSQILNGVRVGRVKRLVVWRLDRLGRTARGLLELCEELQQHGATLVSLREGIDLGTPAGRLMLAVLAGVAEYETEVRKERQTAGIARARAEGKQWGGSSAGRRLKVTQEKEDLVVELHGRGRRITSICGMVGLSRPTVYSILEKHSLRQQVI